MTNDPTPALPSGPIPAPPPDGSIAWVEIELKLDATITVAEVAGQPSEWIKPGATGKVRMYGLPDEEQLRNGYRYIQAGILAPALEEVIVAIQQRLTETRRGG